MSCDDNDFKVGDKVVCVDTGGCNLTEGLTYIVEGVDLDGWPFVFNDIGDLILYNKDKFKKFKPKYIHDAMIEELEQKLQELKAMED